MKRCAGLAGVLFLTVASICNAENGEVAVNNGSELLKICIAAVQLQDGVPNADRFDAGHCVGFLEGVVLADDAKSITCIPGDVSFGQLARVVRRYLVEHPEKLHLHRFPLTKRILADTFPCN